MRQSILNAVLVYAAGFTATLSGTAFASEVVEQDGAAQVVQTQFWEARSEALKEYTALFGETSNPAFRVDPPAMLETLQSNLPRVTVDAVDYFVAEGDLLLDPDELVWYAEARAYERSLYRFERVSSELGFGGRSLAETELVGITQGGNRVVRWRPGLVLTYRIVRSTFPNESQYTTVRDNLRRATDNWEETCGVVFRHAEELDSLPGIGANGAVFTVRYINANGSFIASAFFPNDPPARRRLLVDPSYFGTTFDSVGVLRHELGHVLGFRHEHIRSGAPAACPGEPIADTIPLTDYDPQSTMHYFCGGVGSQNLAITPKDREGSRRVYGPPLNEFVFYE